MDEVKIVREEVGYKVIVNGKVVGMFDEFVVERRIDIGVMLICLRCDKVVVLCIVTGKQIGRAHV